MSTEAWAQLVSTTEAISDPVIISKDRFVLGRNPGADFSFEGNKLISGKHCIIEKIDGKTWLQDTSTNGCLLNFTTKVKKTRVPLRHGDEIHLVYRKADPDANVAFLFQDLAELAKEDTDTTVEYSSEPDPVTDTQPVEEDIEDTTKRNATEELDHVAPPSKRSRQDDSSSEIHNPATTSAPNPGADVAAGENTRISDGDSVESKDAPQSDKKSAAEEKKLDGCGTSEIEKSKAAAADDGPDPYEETLICIICQEILHNCVSLQPCMHSFCSGCYSEWMDRSKECPSCRGEVKRISKNHLVNNFVEVYLKQHPEKRRPEEELKALDARSKITKEQMKPKEPTKDVEDESDDEDDDNNNNDDDDDQGNGSDDEDYSTSDSDTPAGSLPVPRPTAFTQFGLFNPFTPVKFPQTVCRQCPGYVQPPGLVSQAVGAFGTAIARVVNTLTGAGTAGGAATTPEAVPGGSGTAAPRADEGDAGPASRPDEKTMPTPPDYKCTPTQNHALCQCCFEAMPDRRHEHILRPAEIPPMQCRFCYRNYCHAYWGCRKAACLGCLGRFRDMNFGKQCLNGLILENQYESQVLQRYLEGKGMTVKDLLSSCCERLDDGSFSCTDQGRGQFNSETVVCYQCGLRNFKDLAYQYRRHIPDADLPAVVTNRTKCHWGKNCRTQRHKLEHATRFNHICDQTMTTPY